MMVLSSRRMHQRPPMQTEIELKFNRAMIAMSVSKRPSALALIILPMLIQISSAQQSPDRLWTRTSPSVSSQMKATASAAAVDQPADGRVPFIPDAYQLFELDQNVLNRLSRKAVSETVIRADATAVEESVISLPMPDGTFRTFQLIESPVMSPALQAKFPNIRAYRGQCLDDRQISMRLDVSPRGDNLVLRAQVHAPEGTIIVDPFDESGQHMSFVKNRTQRRGRPPHRCIQQPRDENRTEAAMRQRGRGANARVQSGTQLRTYRLAVACTGEYTQFHGGTVASALAAIHTTINRVNEVYERDVAIRFELVDDNDQIVFTDSATDPFTNSSPNQLLSQNQTEIDATIGDANYDIGHIFCTADSGIAPGLVGASGQKAMGVTGQSSPHGDPFDIDYVAHEIGHQLDADHTFNGTGCLPGARFGPTAVEPGSGSTILAYAGICGGDNLQSNSHAYFHSISIEQIVDYSSTGMGAVGSTQATGNGVPTVDAGADFAIPKLTPFKLTATGTDPDNDPLEYCWEQIDRGPAASVHAADDGAIPLFRSFEPQQDRIRVFPKWSDILSGTQSVGEKLPAKERTLQFQVTARDGRSGGGGINTDTSEVDVIETAGPFQVTAPSTSTVNSPLVEVKWDVANTDQSPINCSHVNLLLSTDGGQSFALTLSANTPNDGSELVALPPTAVNNLRILVESTDNIFFAVSPVNFAVESADTRVFLTRHAEKDSDGGDPGLTDVGKDRAQKLADLMSRVGTTHVFSTDTRRTRQTAKPTADATGMSIHIYHSNSDLVSAINSLPSSSRALVVGHSNTVGPIATELGVSETISIGNQFDNLFAIGMRDSELLFAKYKYQPDTSPTQGGHLFAENASTRSSSSRSIAASSETSSRPSAIAARKRRRGDARNAAASSRANADKLWIEPQDTTAAINHPDLYAWRLFVALNWPADRSKRQADPARQFGENADTVWESWKLSSGENDEVFMRDGSDPGPWITDQDSRRAPNEKRERRIGDFESLPLQLRQGLSDHPSAEFDSDTSPDAQNENHLNEDAYRFIRENELYNIEGQEKLFHEAKQKFDQARAAGRIVAPHEYKLHFDVGAKEVKAQWRRISVEDKPRYRWAEFTADDGSKLLYGLTALHITTKDVPNWLWATFEHVDNPSFPGAEPWQTPSVDAAAGPNGYPEGLGIEGTRWENYRLRGTQVDFFDSFGNPTILANSQIERGFQLTSSCITCHARATIGPRIQGSSAANRLSIFKEMLPQSTNSFIRVGNVGALPEELFIQRTFGNPITGDLKYLQLDFVWSLMRANRKTQNNDPLPNEVSFSQHIRPLFRQTDITAMSRFFDLTSHADVSQHADAIHQRLSTGSMPCDSPWPIRDVDLFKKWIDGGKQQ